MSDDIISTQGASDGKLQDVSKVNSSKDAQDNIVGRAESEQEQEPNYVYSVKAPIKELEFKWHRDGFAEKNVEFCFMIVPGESGPDDNIYEVKGLNVEKTMFSIYRKVCPRYGHFVYPQFSEDYWRQYTVSGVDVLNYAFGKNSSLTNYLSPSDKSRIKKLLLETGESFDKQVPVSNDRKSFQDYVARFKNLEELSNLNFPEKYTDDYDLKDNIGFKSIMALKSIYNLSSVQAKMLAYLFANNNRATAIKAMLNSQQYKKGFKSMLLKLRLFEAEGTWDYGRTSRIRMFLIFPKSLFADHFMGKGYRTTTTIESTGLSPEDRNILDASPATFSWARSHKNIRGLDRNYEDFRKHKRWWKWGKEIDRFDYEARFIKDWNFAPLVLRGLLVS